MADHTVVYARGKFDGLLLFLLSVSLAGNVALGYGVASSTATVTSSGRPEPPPVGASLPALIVKTAQGVDERIQFGPGQPSTLLYVFAPNCKWCARNLDNLRALSAAAKARGIRFIGLSLDSDVQEYVRREQLDFPVYIDPDTNTQRVYGLGVTPQTFWISGDGTLQQEWRGAYNGEIKSDLEGLLNVSLPGLTATTGSAAR